mmetsp:Transcript_9273/g.31612  ORF Transcript_9273/g.31612 Transcript_9273/m.31612 type:complete len:382 (-) Transcript_9273:120-1265(-)
MNASGEGDVGGPSTAGVRAREGTAAHRLGGGLRGGHRGAEGQHLAAGGGPGGAQRGRPHGGRGAWRGRARAAATAGSSAGQSERPRCRDGGAQRQQLQHRGLPEALEASASTAKARALPPPTEQLAAALGAARDATVRSTPSTTHPNRERRGGHLLEDPRGAGSGTSAQRAARPAPGALGGQRRGHRRGGIALQARAVAAVVAGNVAAALRRPLGGHGLALGARIRALVGEDRTEWREGQRACSTCLARPPPCQHAALPLGHPPAAGQLGQRVARLHHRYAQERSVPLAVQFEAHNVHLRPHGRSWPAAGGGATSTVGPRARLAPAVRRRGRTRRPGRCAGGAASEGRGAGPSHRQLQGACHIPARAGLRRSLARAERAAR